MRNWKQSIRRLGAVGAAVVSLAMISSCACGPDGPSIQGYGAVVKRDLCNIYETFDRHVWNYDWDDPNLDVD